MKKPGEGPPVIVNQPVGQTSVCLPPLISVLRALIQTPYASAADACSTDCFAGASASSANPMTTSTAEPIKNPSFSLGIWNHSVDITTA